MFRTADLHLTLHSSRPRAARRRRAVVVRAVRGGDSGASSSSRRPPESPAPLVREEIVALFDETERFWKGWLAKSDHRGRWRDMVFRSAITLKLMIYAPTGAPVAAPTAGLPEQVGGERNWDYRYTWVRDGSFSVATLLALGFTEEAEAFIDWLGDRIRERAGDGGDPLQIMYRVDGIPDLDEITLDHGRLPRLASGAHRQRRRRPVPARHLRRDGRRHLPGRPGGAGARATRPGCELAETIDWLCDHWDSRDEAGIWETRGGPQALHLRAPDDLGGLRPGDPAGATHAGARPTWTAGAASATPCTGRSWTRGSTPSSAPSCSTTAPTVLDASLLKMPLVGFIAPGRPDVALDARAPWTGRWCPTASCTATTRRRRPTACGARRARSRCARSGTSRPWPAPAGCGTRGSSSRRCTPTPTTSGCSPRRSAPTGEQLGNFPQAFTHLALINTATMLGDLLDRRRARASRRRRRSR